MKKLMWKNIDEEWPPQSGYYLVSPEIGFVPRLAYFSQIGAFGDWLETINVDIAYEICRKALALIVFDVRVAEKLSKQSAAYLQSEDFDVVLSSYLGDSLDYIHPDKIDLLSEARYSRNECGNDVQYWCEIPNTPSWNDDEEVYAAVGIGTQEIITAIEPHIKRVLAGLKPAGDTPAPWTTTEDQM